MVSTNFVIQALPRPLGYFSLYIYSLLFFAFYILITSAMCEKKKNRICEDPDFFDAIKPRQRKIVVKRFGVIVLVLWLLIYTILFWTVVCLMERLRK